MKRYRIFWNNGKPTGWSSNNLNKLCGIASGQSCAQVSDLIKPDDRNPLIVVDVEDRTVADAYRDGWSVYRHLDTQAFLRRMRDLESV